MILKSVAISRAKISSRSEALFPGNVYVQASSARVDKYQVQTISYSDNLLRLTEAGRFKCFE